MCVCFSWNANLYLWSEVICALRSVSLVATRQERHFPSFQFHHPSASLESCSSSCQLISQLLGSVASGCKNAMLDGGSFELRRRRRHFSSAVSYSKVSCHVTVVSAGAQLSTQSNLFQLAERANEQQDPRLEGTGRPPATRRTTRRSGPKRKEERIGLLRGGFLGGQLALNRNEQRVCANDSGDLLPWQTN